MTDASLPRPILARTNGGDRVHVSTCQYARDAASAVRWAWADTKNSGEVARAVTQHGLQPCRKCKPITALARWENAQRAVNRPTGTAPTTVDLLEFERANPSDTARKHEAVRKLFGITPARYMQLLITAVGTEEALVHDAQLAHQIDARIHRTAADRAALLRRKVRT